MSRIHRLALSGLRSFSPDEAQTIDFFNPVTFIVGDNGTGKTTILETLRFAICGCLPPQSQNGRSFIADPRALNRNETRAAIKLQFSSESDQTIIVTRLIGLSVVKGKEEVKKIDQNINYQTAPGTWACSNCSVAQVDADVPRLLGVSKSIIENIILCHQEDANWPFGDNQHLKGVFDELFDTDKFAKAIESFRKLIREAKTHNKELQGSLNLVRSNYEKHQAALRDYISDSRRYVALLKELEREEALIKEDDEQAQIGPLQKAIVGVEFKLETLKKDKERLDKMTEWVPPRARELMVAQLMAAEFVVDDPAKAEAFLERLQEMLDGREETEVASSSSGVVHNQLGRMESALGRLKQLESRVHGRLGRVNEELEVAIESMRNKNTKGLAHEIRQQLEGFYGRSLELVAVTKPDKLEGHQTAVREARTAAQQDLEQCYTDSANLSQRQREALTALEVRRQVLKHRLDEFSKRENAQELQVMRDTLRVERERLDRATAEVVDLRASIEQSEERLAERREELAVAKREYSAVKYRELIKSRQNLLSQLDMAPDTVFGEGEMDELINQADAASRVATGLVSENQIRRNIENENMRKKVAAADALGARIEEFRALFRSKGVKVDMSAPYEAYRKMRERLKEGRTRLGHMRYALDDFVPRMVSSSIKHGRCFLCQEVFTAQKNEEVARERETRVEAKRREMLEAEGGLALEGGNFEQLHALKKELKESQLRVEERRALEREIEELSERVVVAQYDVEKYRKEYRDVDERQKKLRKLQEVLKDIKDIDPSQFGEEGQPEYQRTEAEVKQLTDEVNLIADTLAAENNMRKEKDALIATISAKIEFLEEKVRDLSGTDADTATEDPELQAMTREEVAKLFQEATAEVVAFPGLCARQTAEVTEKKERLMKTATGLSAIEEKMDRLADLLREDQSSAVKGQLESQLLRLMELNDFMVKAVRLLEDSLASLKTGREVDTLEAELASLKKKEAALSVLVREYRERQMRVQEKKGTVNYLRTHILEQQPKLERSSTQCLELEKLAAQDEANKDLVADMELCVRAMEVATVKFHSQKIDQINAIIGNIWRVTYHGNDIQTVEIVFHQEAPGANGKRSYNYMVMAVLAEGRKVQMRGRCSAGQRLMASIVIRLALSEAFCINCRFLFLDEPTIYLDQRHVRELATFLSRLVETRMDSGFQLVVITHDAEFMSMFDHQMDYYFRVSKRRPEREAGRDVAFSRIEKVALER